MQLQTVIILMWRIDKSVSFRMMWKIILVLSAAVQVLSSNVLRSSFQGLGNYFYVLNMQTNFYHCLFTDFRVKSINGKQLNTNTKIARPSVLIETIQRFRNRTSPAPTSVSGSTTGDGELSLDGIISSLNNHGNILNSLESSHSNILNVVTSNSAHLSEVIEKIIALNDHLANLFEIIQANGNCALQDIDLTKI